MDYGETQISLSSKKEKEKKEESESESSESAVDVKEKTKCEKMKEDGEYDTKIRYQFTYCLSRFTCKKNMCDHLISNSKHWALLNM
jgi:hypothetical protein